MAKKMLIDATHPEETRVVVVEGQRIEEFDYESVSKLQISGNIYLAKVTRVEPSLQAAFVDYGGNRHGFLAFAEIHPDYYQIPVADREALLAAQKAAQADADAEDAEDEPDRKRAKKRGRRSRRRDDDAPETRADEKTDTRGRGGRGRRMGLAPLDAGGALPPGPPEEPGILTARNGPALPAWEDAPDALKAALETPTDGSASVPDLSDVTEISVRRAGDPDEAEALGSATVIETIALSADGAPGARSVTADAPDAAFAAEHASQGTEGGAEGRSEDGSDAAAGTREPALAESAGAELRSVLRDAPIARDGVRDDEDGEAPEDATDDATDDATEDGDEADEARDRSSSDANEIEEVGAEDVRDEIRPRVLKIRDYKIQEVIKKRQILLVQVVKEERGTKGAALTTYISLAGRYCVLMPNTARGGGISRKITNAADRKRLKAVAGELEVPEGMGLIVRTAGANRTKAEIKRDYEYLLRQWSAVRDLTLRSVAPTLIYEEGSLIKRAIRDLYNKDIDAVQVEGEEGYREAKDYMKMLMPSHAKNVQPYRDRTPLFIRHQVESQMAAMLTPTVQLKSGGYLVIGVTEALVAIDENSGRSTKESSIEETALKTNLEAAEEVARQLRLRDLAGLIVIDFIDMEESKNNRAVEKRLKDKLKTDRARIQLGRISGFGLLEMSRQRLRPGLLEATTTPCPHCKGAGVIRSDESMALAILRAIEEEGVRGKAAAVRLAAPVPVANYVMNQKRAKVAMIEARYELQVIIDADPSLVAPDYKLERTTPIRREEPESTAAIQIEAGFAGHELDEPDVYDEAEDDDEDARRVDAEGGDAAESAEARPKRRRRRRRKRDDEAEFEAGFEAEPDAARDGASAQDASADAADEAEGDASMDDDEGDDDGKGGRKRRGRRGGRRRKSRAADSGDPLPVIDLDENAPDAQTLRHQSGADRAKTVHSDRDGQDAPRAAARQATPEDLSVEDAPDGRTAQDADEAAPTGAEASAEPSVSGRGVQHAVEDVADDGAETAPETDAGEAVGETARKEAEDMSADMSADMADLSTKSDADADPATAAADHGAADAPSLGEAGPAAAGERRPAASGRQDEDAAGGAEDDEVAVLAHETARADAPEPKARRRTGWWSLRGA